MREVKWNEIHLTQTPNHAVLIGRFDFSDLESDGDIELYVNAEDAIAYKKVQHVDGPTEWYSANIRWGTLNLEK